MKFDPLNKKQVLSFNFKDLQKDFSGSSPAPFIGHTGYPKVNVGLLSSPNILENAYELDAPDIWSKNKYSIDKIANFRSQLINSSQKASIFDQAKIKDLAQEIAMSSKAVDLEVNLKKKPVMRSFTDEYAAPRGPLAQLQKATMISSPKVHTKVDKVVDDTDLLSSDALNYLYKNDFDHNFLSKLLSVGALGLKKRRKLVPTRWAITASHDTIGKQLIKEVKDFAHADFQCYVGEYLGNHYLILLFPDVWGYELFESYIGEPTNNPKFLSDYESYKGRSQYAFATAGGYYTPRLAILEQLKKMKRQASCLAIRIITPEYTTPLGVWVTLQAARNAMSNKPITFASRELLIAYAKDVVKRKFGSDISLMLKQSMILRELSSQRKISEY